VSIRVIGIDPGSRFTGYGLLDIDRDGCITCIDYGTFKTLNKWDFSQKLLYLGDEFCKILEKHQAQQMIIEKIFVGKNVDSAFKLGHVRGLFMYWAAKYSLSVHEITPRAAKKQVTGNGGASKEHVKLVVSSLLSIKVDLDIDTSDALALAICRSRQIEVERTMSQLRGVSL